MSIFLLYFFTVSKASINFSADSLNECETSLRIKENVLDGAPDLDYGDGGFGSATLRRSKRSLCLKDMCGQNPTTPLRDWSRREAVCCSLQTTPLKTNLKKTFSASNSKIAVGCDRFDIQAYLNDLEKNNETPVQSNLKNTKCHDLIDSDILTSTKKPALNCNEEKSSEPRSRSRSTLPRSSIPRLSLSIKQANTKHSLNKTNRKHSLNKTNTKHSLNKANINLMDSQVNRNIQQDVEKKDNFGSLVSFGNKSYEHLHLKEIEIPTKLHEHNLKAKKMLSSVEDLSVKIQNFSRTNLSVYHMKNEDREHVIKETEDLIANILQTLEDVGKLFPEILKVIDEVPSDDQYEQFIILNKKFDIINIFRDQLLNEIDKVIFENKISFKLTDVLEKFKTKAGNLLNQMNEEVKKINIFSDTIKKNTPDKENYGRDYEILIRVFEYFYALVIIEEYRIENEKNIQKSSTKEAASEIDRVFSFDKIPNFSLHEIFTHDVSQFFNSADNDFEMYWSVIRIFVKELEKYSDKLLFDPKCSIDEFFEEITEIFNKIGNDKKNKYRNIANRIVQSNILSAIHDEILILHNSGFEKSDLSSEVENLLLETLDCYLLIE